MLSLCETRNLRGPRMTKPISLIKVSLQSKLSTRVLKSNFPLMTSLLLHRTIVMDGRVDQPPSKDAKTCTLVTNSIAGSSNSIANADKCSYINLRYPL